MSDTFYGMELMARERTRRAAKEMQRRQMLACVTADRGPRLGGLGRVLKERLRALGGWAIWFSAGRAKRLPAGKDAIG